METIEDLFRRLEQLNEIGSALSKERDIERLLESILMAAKNITHADGGTLYRVTDDHRALRFAILHNDTLKVDQGGTSKTPVTLPDLPLADAFGHPNYSLVAVYAALKARTVNVADAYTERGFDFSGTRRFDEQSGYRSKSFLTVPMMNHEGEVIAVLQLINARNRQTRAVQPFTAADQRLVESLASQAAIALSNRQLLAQMEELFESFIKLINLAIDEKSPYTGEHCQRVPALTMMLAEAVNGTRDGPLAGFTMSDKDRYELKIASLLHDCGKVTTPVHIVDKATKLQTLFDRIHLVDTRFEVLKRDAEIAALKDMLMLRECRDATGEERRREQLQGELRAIDADRDFLRLANIGRERTHPVDRKRVRDIGTERHWRNCEGAEADFLSADEIENLAISSGTLTPAEREIIHYHIVATIKMLEQLPWPKELQNVPEYAGGHHERMDGKGYPKGLRREQMSVPARIMGIADIFEALTARDRPYKDGMKLSEAMLILGKFSVNGHIDPDLFQVFVAKKVYLDYARQFLDPSQIDAVDESTLPGFAPTN
jgi:HD-GYP domain-containing protein (c-di-GMP phosphodiesterase class II)